MKYDVTYSWIKGSGYRKSIRGNFLVLFEADSPNQAIELAKQQIVKKIDKHEWDVMVDSSTINLVSKFREPVQMYFDFVAEVWEEN